jgi:3-(3-hydroxy-phenyl)propionate hydroxylase
MNAQSNGAPASLPEYVPVIVIGAGPTGMTAATMLAQQGIECLLLDRHETSTRCRGRCTPTTRSTGS